MESFHKFIARAATMQHGIEMVTKRTREPNGRLQREKEPAPAAVRRLMDAALTDMRHAEWGTQLGRLALSKAISESMYAAGKKWAEIAAKYQGSIGVFPVRTPNPQVGRAGSPPDPDSPDGRRIANRETNNAERFFEADAVLVNAGPGIRLIVRRVCEDDEMPCGLEELARLRAGLMCLVSHWNLTGGRKSDSVR